MLIFTRQFINEGNFMSKCYRLGFFLSVCRARVTENGWPVLLRKNIRVCKKLMRNMEALIVAVHSVAKERKAARVKSAGRVRRVRRLGAADPGGSRNEGGAAQGPWEGAGCRSCGSSRNWGPCTSSQNNPGARSITVWQRRKLRPRT